MFYPLYRLITGLSAPFLLRLLKKRLFRGKEHPTRWPERTGIITAEHPGGRLLWIHGASVGESLSALPLINALLDENKGALHIMMTTGTVTSAALMEKRLPEGAFHQFIPVDHPQWVNNFMNHWKPNAVLWLESELWPNFINEIGKRQIPAALVNARMSEKSFRKWKKFAPGTARKMLSTFTTIFAQTQKDAGFYSELGAKNTSVIGNLKFAAEPLPFKKDDLFELENVLKERPSWLFASTHKGEEEQAVAVHRQLKSEIPGFLTIIAMRHPNRKDEVIKLLSGSGLNITVRSEGNLPDNKTDIYLIDTLGEMGLFYALSDITVIGGSFVPHGGHNPIEPAAMNCAVIAGPHMFNFLEICEQMEEADALIRTSDAAGLKSAISDLLHNKEMLDRHKQNAESLVDRNRAVLPILVDAVRPLLKPKGGKP